jgi:hypothetical protein
MRSLAWLAFLVAGCGVSGVGIPGDGGKGNGDMSASVFDFAGTGGPCSDTNPCPQGQRCLEMVCIPDNGTCNTDSDCENDTYCDCTSGGGGDMGACMGGICVPYGDGPRGSFDPGCQGGGFSASDFKPPVVGCQWKPTMGEMADVIMTPIVVDLDLDGKPEIVFENFDNSSQGLVAIHGHDCSPMFEKPNLGLLAFSQLAAADLDGDKFPEIIAVDSTFHVTVYDHNGNQLAKSPTPYLQNAIGSDCVGVAVADVDGDGKPEMLAWGQVTRYVKGQNQLTVLWNNKVSTGNSATWGALSTFADLDGDGKPEAITGLKVYDGATGADKTPGAFGMLGSVGAYPQVADFNKDGKPDILLVQSGPNMQQVSITDVANNKIIFGPYTVGNGGGWGGPAIVADFDGDKVPDFGLAGTNHYYVYALKCGTNNPPPDCKGPDKGVLWERDTHDDSSGGTASSVFDFNGDGKAEVVYRDECWLRVMNGPDGKTVFAQQITSGTCLEMPIVADVDNDGHADLIVPSDNVQGPNYCMGVPEGQTGQMFTGSTEGIFVLKDPMNRWMPSRSIWNQHTYHITNINDNASVPPKESPNWKMFNNFRQNVQGLAGGSMPQPDTTGGVATMLDNGGNDCKVSERLWANLCNRGASTVAAGVPGAFYDADPRMGGKLICTTMTMGSLDPGMCEAVFCDWKNPPQGPADVWFRANDNGTMSGVVPECDQGNDLLFMPQVQCFVPG